MLSENDFQHWCDRNKISEEAKQEIQIIRSSEPSRKVGGGKRSVSGRYSSQKMGVTIQFESHKVELPFIYQLEHDEDVLEYYDQPPPFKLSYQSESGKNIGFFYTPDFFVIRTDSAGWWECKTEENLQKLAQKNPNRYFLDDDNHWRCPSAEDYANRFGWDFSIWSSASVNWTMQRNLEFLEDYYRLRGRKKLNESSFIAIISIIKAKPGITLLELFHVSENIEADDIYHLIAQETIYLDLSVAPLVEPEKCLLFCDRVTALSYSAITASQATNNTVISPIIDLNVGNIVIYNGKALTIALIGEDNILLQTAENQSIEFPQDTFENLIRQGKITSFQKTKTNEIDPQALELLQQASEKDLKDANYRYHSIQPYLNGEPIRRDTPQERSLRNWLSAYNKARHQYGYGYLGLLSFEHQKGNRNRRLPQNILDKIDDFIENHYETKKQPTKQSTYAAFANFCAQAGIPDCQIPTYKTFIKEIKKHSGYEQTLKRAGSRAAYELEQFYWELNLTTPRHGDFPFHICHIDHTQSDIELRCSKTGKSLGRPWITFLVDAFSRSILAVYITYDPPSYRSCMMVLRICVQRHGRLPQTIITDNGKEFHSTYFETLLAMFECTLKHRPAAKSRFSGVCERLFGTTNQQLLYNLAGNTQITKKVRLATKSVNPKNLSLWNIGLLYLYLCEWAYEVYETTEHPALDGYSPREAFINGVKQFGNRDLRRIAYDNNFKILTLPTTSQGKAKVRPGKGVKIEYKDYWHNALRDPEIENNWVDVRYDPFNAGIAYVYVRGQWVECISEYYPLFRGRSEKEIRLATAELKKRHQNHHGNYKIRAKQLGNFLAKTETEEILLEQRLRDEQTHEVFRVIEGGTPNVLPFTSPTITVEETVNTRSKPNMPVEEKSSSDAIEPPKFKRFKKY
ncbi:Integrase catalytic region [Stanieria sp. NIES-3757]|nr:Integrase catalytic region [Stanieria sp. NIES-3757]